MKRFTFCILLIFTFMSCSKEEDSNGDIPTGIPTWLRLKILEIKKDPTKKTTLVEKYAWDYQYFYNIKLPSKNCILCDVYNANGILQVNVDLPENSNYLGIIWMFE